MDGADRAALRDFKNGEAPEPAGGQTVNGSRENHGEPLVRSVRDASSDARCGASLWPARHGTSRTPCPRSVVQQRTGSNNLSHFEPIPALTDGVCVGGRPTHLVQLGRRIDRDTGDEAGSLDSDGDPVVAAAEHDGAGSRQEDRQGCCSGAEAASLQWKARSASGSVRLVRRRGTRTCSRRLSALRARSSPCTCGWRGVAGNPTCNRRRCPTRGRRVRGSPTCCQRPARRVGQRDCGSSECESDSHAL